MLHTKPAFTIGIEEDYLLVDKETRALVIDASESLLCEVHDQCG